MVQMLGVFERALIVERIIAGLERRSRAADNAHSDSTGSPNMITSRATQTSLLGGFPTLPGGVGGRLGAARQDATW